MNRAKNVLVDWRIIVDMLIGELMNRIDLILFDDIEQGLKFAVDFLVFLERLLEIAVQLYIHDLKNVINT